MEHRERILPLWLTRCCLFNANVRVRPGATTQRARCLVVVLSGHLFRTCQRVRPRDHRHGAFYTRFLKIIRKNAGSFVACRPILGGRGEGSPPKKSKTVPQTHFAPCHIMQKSFNRKDRKWILSETLTFRFATFYETFYYETLLL